MRKILKSKKGLLTFIVIVLSFAMIGLTACSSEGMTEEEGKGKIVLADPQWDSVQFHNAVVKTILKEGYGYETEIISGSSSATFTGLENGDVDVLMEAWVQNIKEMYDRAISNGDIIEASTNFDDNMQGLYVPTYVIEGDPERGIEPMAPGLKTVKDLAKYPEVFQDEEDPSKGRIYGAPPGWEVDGILRTKLEGYGLLEQYNYFSPGSSSGLAVSLGTSYENGDPWVGYYWEPEWVMEKYDVTLLEDEPFDEEKWSEEAGYACKWPAIEVTVAVHKDLQEKAPEVFEFLSNYQTSKDLNNEVLAYMQDTGSSKEETAIWFLKEYEEVWTSWVPEDIATKVKEAI